MPIPSELSPDAVSTWSEQLPYANKAVLARETYELIQGVAAASLQDKQRMQVLQTVKVPADTVIQHIKTHLTTADTRAAEMLSLGEAYCRQLVAMALPVATGKSKRGLLPFSGQAEQQGRDIANHFLVQWQLLDAIDHRATPDGLWSQLSALHAHHPGRKNAALSQAVALHIADTRRMSAPQIQDLAALLTGLPMEKLVRVGKAGEHIGESRFYLPQGDTAPEYGAVPKQAFPIDLDGLVRHISEHRPEAFDARFTDELIERWSGRRADKLSRALTPRPLTADAVVGLHNILRQLGAPQDLYADPGASPDSGSFTTGTGVFAQRDPVDEVSITDNSDGGCRLHTGHRSIQAGDIIAILWGRVAWRVGTIAWLLRDAELSECGVQWLLDEPKVVSVRFEGHPEAPALSGRSCLDGRPALLYASHPKRRPDACLLRTDSAWSAYDLKVSKQAGLAEMASCRRSLPKATAPATSRPAHNGPEAAQDEIWKLLANRGS